MGLFDFLNKKKKPDLVCTHPGMRQVEEYLAGLNGAVPYTATQDSENCKLVLRLVGQAGYKYNIILVCKPTDHNNIKIRVFGLPKIAEHNVDKALLILNEYHSDINTTFFKLSIDSDNDVVLTCDLPTCTDNPGAVVEEALSFISITMGELYPQLSPLA